MTEDKGGQDLRAGFILGPWTVQPNQNLIDDGQHSNHLEPKVMEVLCFLARRQDEVVSRSELIEEVWKGTYVGDEVLSRAISVLRAQLGDDRKNASYIVTVPKAGYRLIMSVAPLPSSEPGGSVFQRHARFFRFAVPGVVLALVAAVFLTATQPPPPPPDPNSPTLYEDLSDWFQYLISGGRPADSIFEIAVLPFEDISEASGNAFFSDGLTDELIGSLSRVEGLKVVARSSSLSLRHRHEDVRAIGDFLQVDAVIEGTVKRVGDRIRISCQLSSTQDGYVLWSETYDRNLDDLLVLQDELSRSIVSALREKLALTELQAATDTSPTPNMAAYQLYLYGKFLGKLRGEVPLRKSISLFEQALEQDPLLTRAALGLANAYIELPFYSTEDEEEMFSRALALLAQLVVISEEEAAEIEGIKGFIAFRQWRWIDAERHFRKALVLAPRNPNLYVFYSQLLASVGRVDDAVKAAQQANELDAVSPVANNLLAASYLMAKDNLRAAEQFAVGAELGFNNQRNPAYLLFLTRTGRFSEAGRVIENLYDSNGADPRWLLDNLEAISSGTAERALVEVATEHIEAGDIPPRFQVWLWLKLDQPERVYETVMGYASQKKQVDFGLLFTQEAEMFKDSGTFDQLVEDTGLAAYWARYEGPD